MNRKAVVKELKDKFFSNLINWSPPQYVKSPSPQFNDVFDKFIRRRDNALASVTAMLMDTSDNNIKTLVQASPGLNSTQLIQFSDEYQDIWDEAEHLAPPVWWAGGFGVEDHQADFKHWSQLKTWTRQQTVALSIGFDPEKLNFHHRSEVLGFGGASDFLERRIGVIENNFGKLDDVNGTGPTPVQFCEWAVSVQLEVPKDLLEAVSLRSQIIADHLVKASGPVEKNIDPRERATLLKLVIGLAIVAYKYDPTKKHNPIYKEIRDDLSEVGPKLDVTEEIIRKHLKSAAKYLP